MPVLQRMLAALLLAGAGAAQTAATAAAVTEPGRTIFRPLDVVLGGGEKDADRVLLLLVDPSPGLEQSGVVEALARAIRENPAAMARTELGLAVLGQKGAPAVAPTKEHGRVVDALRTALARPAGDFVDVYSGVRAALPTLGPPTSARTILLLTLENGDVERDVDGVARELERGKIRCEVVTGEATLSDSFWAARPGEEHPRGTTMTGGDSALHDVPWGWLFQHEAANEATPAGFAMWGLTRLAAASGGRVFLYAPNVLGGHDCGRYHTCLFCDGDHAHPDDNWYEPLVDQLAPSASTRSEVHAELGGDPHFRAMIDAWRKAAEAGLVSVTPGVKLTATGAEPDRIRPGKDLDLTDGATLERHARRAEEAAGKAAQIGRQLRERIDAVKPGEGLARTEAAARYTLVMLELTRVNLRMYAAWCTDTAPALFGKEALATIPPEVASVSGEERGIGVWFLPMNLCHGVAPYLAVELPGMLQLRADFEGLDGMFREYLQRYGRSQFGLLLRRNSIPRFEPAFPGAVGRAPRQRPKSSKAKDGPITPQRPARSGGSGGGSSGGGTSGPTTGGGGR